MKILIIEDQENLAKAIVKGLALEGFVSDFILDGEDGFKRALFSHEEYDLLLLDSMLPGKLGIEICKDLRAKNIHLPILMLTAKNELGDITAALNAGADDYLTKPFSFEELIARIRAILRRPKISLPEKLKIQDLILDPVTKKVTRKKQAIFLTLKEFNLLEYLMRHPNQALTREDILSSAWDFTFDSFANVVDVHMTSLRKKLNDHDNNLIETIRGVGYKIKTKK